MRRPKANRGQTTLLAVIVIVSVAIAFPLTLNSQFANDRKTLSGWKYSTAQHRIIYALQYASNSPLALKNTMNDPSNASLTSCIQFGGANCLGMPAITVRDDANQEIIAIPNKMYDINGDPCTTPSETCLIKVSARFDTTCGNSCGGNPLAEVRIHFKIEQDTGGAALKNIVGSAQRQQFQNYQGNPIRFSKVNLGY